MRLIQAAVPYFDATSPWPASRSAAVRVASAAWNRFVVHTIQYTRYEINVLRGDPPNPFDIRVYGHVGGTQIVRAGSVFLSALTCGFYLVLGFALALERAARDQGRRWMIAALVLLGAGLLLTQTRSAILGALVVTFLAFRPAVELDDHRTGRCGAMGWAAHEHRDRASGRLRRSRRCELALRRGR